MCRVSRVSRVNVSMHFVCAFDSCIRLKTAAKVKNFPSHGKLGLNLGPPKCQSSAYATRATAFPALYGAKTACKLTDEEIFLEVDGNIMNGHDSNNTTTKGNVCWGPRTEFLKPKRSTCRDLCQLTSARNVEPKSADPPPPPPETGVCKSTIFESGSFALVLGCYPSWSSGNFGTNQ